VLLSGANDVILLGELTHRISVWQVQGGGSSGSKMKLNRPHAWRYLYHDDEVMNGTLYEGTWPLFQEWRYVM